VTAVIKVEGRTKADTGVGTAIATGDQEEKAYIFKFRFILLLFFAPFVICYAGCHSIKAHT
jgi:hypothetical protein